MKGDEAGDEDMRKEGTEGEKRARDSDQMRVISVRLHIRGVQDRRSDISAFTPALSVSSSSGSFITSHLVSSLESHHSEMFCFCNI